jgi:hypothetical protein
MFTIGNAAENYHRNSVESVSSQSFLLSDLEKEHGHMRGPLLLQEDDIEYQDFLRAKSFETTIRKATVYSIPKPKSRICRKLRSILKVVIKAYKSRNPKNIYKQPTFDC